MNRATLASLLGLVAALLAATQLEPSMGRGVMAGALLSGAVGLGGVTMQIYVARRSPARVAVASVASFGMILLAVLAGALLLRFLPTVSDAVDYRGFLLAFASLGFLLLIIGSMDVASALKQGSAL